MTLDQNPVAWAELRHQRYVIRNGRAGWLWIVMALLMLIPALLASISFYGAALLGVEITLVFSLPQVQSLGDFIMLGLHAALLGMNIALYPVVMLISLALAGSSITREKTAHTWDLLRLSEMDARTLVSGKFRASLRALIGDHMFVGVLRLGLLALVLQLQQGGPAPALDLFFLGGLLLLATALDAMMNTIMALLVTLTNWPGSVSVNVFVGLRVAATIYGLGWIGATVGYLSTDTPASPAYVMTALGGLLLYGLAFLLCYALTLAAAVHGSGLTAARRGNA